MAAERVAAIVEIERMGRDAVDQRRAEHVETLAAAENQCRAGGCGLAQGTPHDRRGLLPRAGQGDADGVKNAVFRHRNGFARKRFEGHVADVIGEAAEQHRSLGP